MTQPIRLSNDVVTVEIDPVTASVTALRGGGRDYIAAERSGSLLRLAVPIEGYDAHSMLPGTVPPKVEASADKVVLTYPSFKTPYLDLPVEAVLTLRVGPEGLVVSAKLTNHGEQVIPQVAFPQLLGLTPRKKDAEPILTFPGRRMRPLTELAMEPHDMTMLENKLQEYVYYGYIDFTMKWIDFGDSEAGLTWYGRDGRYTTQGVLVERQDRAQDFLNLRWVHYPELRRGETWESGEFVLLPHAGDWYAGAKAYQAEVRDRYPYRGPRHIREALAIRSIWAALRNTPPTMRFTELPEYAAEVADPDLGINEIVLWHWWLKNGLPMIIDNRLGTEDELKQALAKCREMGVPISMFVSHHILREGAETDPDWVHRNRAQQAIVWNWTYSDQYLPKFGVRYTATHSMVKASALSPGWRAASLAEYRRIMSWGAAAICFDVYYGWGEPNYSPSADGRPDEDGERLIEFGKAAREIIHKANPEGSFSGEWPSDLKVPIIDYTWDWRNSKDVAECAPFRYVFPQFRLNANVGAHPRGPALAFMEGALLNIMPGGLRTERLTTHPALLAQLKRLNGLRRRFMPFFTEGQFHFKEALEVSGAEARLYSYGGELLVIACNPSDDPAEVSLTVRPGELGLAAQGWRVTKTASDGSSEQAPASLSQRFVLGPDDVAMIHLSRAELG